MEIMYIIIIALLFVAVAVLSTLYALQSRRARDLDSQLSASTDMLHGVEQARDAAVVACDTARAQREAEQMARIKAETELEAERRAAREREAHQQDIERMMREQFRAMAGDIMGEQSRRFKEENRESMDLILKPFKDNIMEFRTRVENIFSHQNEQQGALKSELQRLMELNSQITTETTNLTNALKDGFGSAAQHRESVKILFCALIQQVVFVDSCFFSPFLGLIVLAECVSNVCSTVCDCIDNAFAKTRNAFKRVQSNIASSAQDRFRDITKVIAIAERLAFLEEVQLAFVFLVLIVFIVLLGQRADSLDRSIIHRVCEGRQVGVGDCLNLATLRRIGFTRATDSGNGIHRSRCRYARPGRSADRIEVFKQIYFPLRF